MKKNRMMRLASGLLVAVLATTSVISGTYAKYTTQDSANDSARVAKWGVELQVVGNLYGDSYTNGIVKDKEDTGENIRVNAADTSDVVAPGTLNTDGFTFKVNGTPEVDYQATVVMKHQNIFLDAGTYGVMVAVKPGIVTDANYDEFKGLYTLTDGIYKAATGFATDTTYYTLEDDVELTATYYPVVYTLAGVDAGKTEYNAGTVYADGEGKDSLTAIVDAIGKSVVANTAGANGTTTTTAAASTNNNMTRTMTYVSEVKDSNDPVETVLKLSEEKLTWEWKFCSDSEACTAVQVGDSAKMLCKADTILGNLMAGVAETQVVVLNDDGTYEKLVLGGSADVNNYLVFRTSDDARANALACLQTSFDINITVTQVD